jgi:hypothetical protein
MPVHENKFGTNQSDGYIRAAARNAYNDSVPDLDIAGELRDIA